MLLAMVNGVLFGEETNIVVPSGGTATTRHTIFRSPMVYIDSDSGIVPREDVRAWAILIERCLRFAPQDRFPSAADLAGEIEQLLNRNSLGGKCTFPLNFGRVDELEANDGERPPCWMV